MRERSIITGGRILIASIVAPVGLGIGGFGRGDEGVPGGSGIKFRFPVSRKIIGSIVLATREDLQSPVFTIVRIFLPAQQRTK